MADITLNNVSFSYGESNIKVLKNINLKFTQSGFYLLCGKSGCGKSTLLRQLKKNLIPYGILDGSVTYCETEISKMDSRASAEKIGFVMQDPESQIVTDKVWHELAFGLENLGFSNEIIKKRVAEMANYFGIQTWFREKTSSLSGGQKQLLNLASIMVMQPKVLILDEPTAQLDPLAASDFLQTINKLNKDFGITIIISEHRLEEVFSMADKIILMEKGEVLSVNTPEKTAAFVISQNRNSSIYYGLPSVIKIFGEIQKTKKLPMTIREGKIAFKDVLHNYKEHDESLKPPEVKKNKNLFATISHSLQNKSNNIPLIEIKDGWFRYESQSRDILRGTNLQLHKGDWFCLMGGNGAGKSTILNVIFGSYPLYRGKIVCNCGFGTKGMVLLPQNPQMLFTEITVYEELLVTAQKLYPKEADYNKQISETLSLMELLQYKDIHPYDLSGGEQQRLALGKLLLLEPSVLLMDEPTKGLDPYFKRKLAKILWSLMERGLTIFMVSHDIEFCAEYGKTCGMFFDGEVISIGNSHEFFSGNSFYTTNANKLIRSWNKNAITCKEVIDICQEQLI